MRLFVLFATLFVITAVAIPQAQANVKQLKVYRQVYPDYKPKCGYCHVDDKPKKDDGKHDLNAYGLKMQELMNGEDLTEDMVRELGNHEEFEAAAEGTEEMSANTSIEKDEQTADPTAQLVAQTKELVEETKQMVSETQEMVRQTRDVVDETAAATEQVRMILADQTPEYALNATQPASGE